MPCSVCLIVFYSYFVLFCLFVMATTKQMCCGSNCDYCSIYLLISKIDFAFSAVESMRFRSSYHSSCPGLFFVTIIRSAVQARAFCSHLPNLAFAICHLAFGIWNLCLRFVFNLIAMRCLMDFSCCRLDSAHRLRPSIKATLCSSQLLKMLSTKFHLAFGFAWHMREEHVKCVLMYICIYIYKCMYISIDI